MPNSSTILLVDDEESIQTLLTYPLERDGYTVVQARDGEEALKRFDEASIDLVVLDVMSAMAAAGSSREVLLPLLVLPLAIPLVVGGVGSAVSAEPGRFLLFLALYDGVFAVLSWASFEYVVTE